MFIDSRSLSWRRLNQTTHIKHQKCYKRKNHLKHLGAGHGRGILASTLNFHTFLISTSPFYNSDAGGGDGGGGAAEGLQLPTGKCPFPRRTFEGCGSHPSGTSGSAGECWNCHFFLPTVFSLHCCLPFPNSSVGFLLLHLVTWSYHCAFSSVDLFLSLVCSLWSFIPFSCKYNLCKSIIKFKEHISFQKYSGILWQTWTFMNIVINASIYNRL